MFIFAGICLRGGRGQKRQPLKQAQGPRFLGIVADILSLKCIQELNKHLTDMRVE